MGLHFRQFQHLLPDSQAWRLTVTKTLRSFFLGLEQTPADAVAFVDGVYSQLAPPSTTELVEWEKQFGIEAEGNDAARRLTLAAEWQATGGQSPSYIQTILRAAGFDVYVYEWWSSGPPYVARDPRMYTSRPLIGTVQCVGDAFRTTGQSECGEKVPAPQPECNAFLSGDPGYLVNKDLTPRAPPPVPDDPAFWPFFIYIAGATFPLRAQIDPARRAVFERLILKLRPLQHWIVTLVSYSGSAGIFDTTFDSTFE